MLLNIAEEQAETGDGSSGVVNTRAFNEAKAVEKARIWITLTSVSGADTRITFTMVGLIGFDDSEVELFSIGPLMNTGVFTDVLDIPPQFVRLDWVLTGISPSFDFVIDLDTVPGPI